MAFTAQHEKGAPEGSDLADGQIQVNRRGSDPVKFHGTIDCLVVNGGRSEGVDYMSGTSRANKNLPAQPFELYVSDDGSADDEQGPCGFAEEVSGVSMGRGSVRTWNNDTSEDQEPEGRMLGLTNLLRLK